ncbi:MAG: hypothetical protein ACLU4N_25595 [Butyricimonas faecihominis]
MIFRTTGTPSRDQLGISEPAERRHQNSSHRSIKGNEAMYTSSDVGKYFNRKPEFLIRKCTTTTR